MSEELKVCPFCGGKAQVVTHSTPPSFATDAWTIGCVSSDCRGSEYRRQGGLSSWWGSEEGAARAWNTRAAVASPAPGGGSDSQSMLQHAPEQPSPTSALREKVARVIDPDEWLSVDAAARAFDLPRDLPAITKNHCKRSLAKADEILSLLQPVQHMLDGDVTRAWQIRSENLELALSKICRPPRRFLDAHDDFLSPDAKRHSNLLREEAEAWNELRQVFSPCNLDPSSSAQKD